MHVEHGPLDMPRAESPPDNSRRLLLLNPLRTIAMSKPKTLVACKIVADELYHVLQEYDETNIVWINAGLHSRPECLADELDSAIEKVKADGNQARILLGSGCHPDMCSYFIKKGLGLPPAANCIEAFCGEKKHEMEAENAMIMTPGWIRCWPEIMEGYGWDGVDVRMNLGRYDKIVVLEPGINPLTEEEILEFFDLTQVTLDVRPFDLVTFRETVHRVMSDDSGATGHGTD